MIIRYMNAKGEEKILANIIFMQNINNDEWEAITEDNKILTLVTSRIEAVMEESIRSENNDRTISNSTN